MSNKSEQKLIEIKKNYFSLITKYHPEFKESWQIFQDLGRKTIKQNMIIMNVGAGHSSRLDKFFLKAKLIYGLDPDSKALKQNKFINKKIIGTAEKIPLPDHSVDIVILEWVLEHLQNPKKVISEISRVLRLGGKILFVTPNLYCPIICIFAMLKLISGTLSKKIIQKFLPDRNEEDVYPAYYRINTVTSINKLFNNYNLKIRRWETTDCPGYFYAFPPLVWLVLYWNKISKNNILSWLRAYLLGIAYKTK